jgi:hypothetical protein
MTNAKTSKDDAGQAEVQAAADQAQEQGYYGTVPDKTPNENYTLQGQANGASTPETDRGAAPGSEG